MFTKNNIIGVEFDVSGTRYRVIDNGSARVKNLEGLTHGDKFDGWSAETIVDNLNKGYNWVPLTKPKTEIYEIY